MIDSWRQNWVANAGTDPVIPFIYAQISSTFIFFHPLTLLGWSAGDSGVVSELRYAQQSGLTRPGTAMVVTADKGNQNDVPRFNIFTGDPAGILHPIHPPWKKDVGYRASIAARNLMYGENVPLSGPRVVSAAVHWWDKSWGNFHYGMSGEPGCTIFSCIGITVTFDQQILAANNYGAQFGYPNGFKLVHENGVSFQPLSFLGTVEGNPFAIQLNITWTFGTPQNPQFKTLYYGWGDYPSLVLYNSFSQPAPPFNITISK